VIIEALDREAAPDEFDISGAFDIAPDPNHHTLVVRSIAPGQIADIAGIRVTLLLEWTVGPHGICRSSLSAHCFALVMPTNLA
jgi:hypothetical protein